MENPVSRHVEEMDTPSTSRESTRALSCRVSRYIALLISRSHGPIKDLLINKAQRWQLPALATYDRTTESNRAISIAKVNALSIKASLRLFFAEDKEISFLGAKDLDNAGSR